MGLDGFGVGSGGFTRVHVLLLTEFTECFTKSYVIL